MSCGRCYIGENLFAEVDIETQSQYIGFCSYGLRLCNASHDEGVRYGTNTYR